MDWNTEVASDWPGTDGRELVHGLTHEFDSDGNTFGESQVQFVGTWAKQYVNGRYAFSVGQVYCNPDDPKPGDLNPDRTSLNSMPDGSYVIKLLFSTVNEAELSTVKDAFEWDADIYVNKSPRYRNAGPLSRFARKLGKVHPETAQSLRMMYFGNVPGGAVFSDTQLYSTDYSLQLSMSLQNFVSLRCAKDASAPLPSLCKQLVDWAELQKKGTKGVLVFLAREAQVGRP
jgi:hypothetical protein